jgi:hypothetical protein
MLRHMNDSNSADFTMGLKQAGTTCREAGGPMRIGTAAFAIHLYREAQWMNTVTAFTKGTKEHFAAMATGRP